LWKNNASNETEHYADQGGEYVVEQDFGSAGAAVEVETAFDRVQEESGF